MGFRARWSCCNGCSTEFPRESLSGFTYRSEGVGADVVASIANCKAGESAVRTSMIRRRNGFTLVELLIVLAIIGVLAGILVPTAYSAFKRAKTTSLKMEVDMISSAVEQFRTKYGEYPPDGSSWPAVERVLRLAFPRILDSEIMAVKLASSSSINRGEALVFFLGGFSSNPEMPITGEGGPLIKRLNQGQVYFIYNTSRSNAIFDFEATRLTLAQDSVTGDNWSTDEELWGILFEGMQEPVKDVLPCYRPKGITTPIVYFAAKTYAFQVGNNNFFYNKFYGTNIRGVARPYKSTETRTVASNTPALFDKSRKYVNEKTFQIITAGLDDNFGGIIANSNGYEILFSYNTGDAFYNPAAFGNVNIAPRYNASNEQNAQLDNVTNFTEATIDDGLEN